MHVDTVLTLVAACLAFVAAVFVPYMTFRLALRQDQTRWLRDQRAALYVDLLLEAHAEQEWFEYATADDDTRERMSMYFKDLRLPETERARLGARGTVFASSEVNARFNQLEGIMARSSLVRPGYESERSALRVRIDDAATALQTVIRDELGTDSIALTADR
jgi:hypothetical protein